MCEATSIALLTLAISAASADVGYASQSEQAKAQESYQEDMAQSYKQTAEKNAVMANQEYTERMAAERVSQMQAQDSMAQQEEAIRKERLSKMGTAMASSEAAGQNLQFLMDDYHRQEANHNAILQQQYGMQSQSAETAIQGYRLQAKNRGQSYQQYISSPIQQPSLIAAGLQFAGGALSAYDKATDGGKTSLWGDSNPFPGSQGTGPAGRTDARAWRS